MAGYVYESRWTPNFHTSSWKHTAAVSETEGRRGISDVGGWRYLPDLQVERLEAGV